MIKKEIVNKNNTKKKSVSGRRTLDKKSSPARKKTNVKKNKKGRSFSFYIKTIKDKCIYYYDKLRKFYFEHKKTSIAIITVFVLVIILLFINSMTRNYTSSINSGHDNYAKTSDFMITYKNGKELKFDDFNHSFVAEKEIIIENNTSSYENYVIEWKIIKNTLSHQSNFTYTLQGKGNNSANIGASQVPVASFKFLSNYVISPGKKHVYKLTFNYKRHIPTEKGKFEGYLDIHSN